MKVSTVETLKLNIALLTMTFAFIGCASVTYDEPTSGPLARVRFVTDKDNLTVVKRYASKQCDGEHQMLALRKGYFLNSETRKLGIPLWNYHENAAKELLIRAGEPQIYMMEEVQHIGQSIYRHGVIIQQTFENGKDYEVSYKSSGNVEVYEIKTNSLGKPEKVLIQKRDNSLPDGFSKTCVTQFKDQSLPWTTRLVKQAFDK